MNLTNRVFALLLCFAFIISSQAQVSKEIRPMSALISARFFSTPDEHVFSFDLVDAAELDRRVDRAGHAPGFAHSMPADISLSNSGTWSAMPDGGRVWRVRLSSPGALALIPCFDQFYLPDGAALHVYDPAKEEIIGAFTAANNPADGIYNTGLIHGESCIIEYYEPSSSLGKGRIHLNELGHAYRMVPPRKSTQDFGNAEACEVNVKCSEGNNWQDQKNAVVRILIKSGTSFSWCSGALVNNTNQDCTPYILSADHCYQDDLTGVLPSVSDMNQWVFYFLYESPNCANPSSEGSLGNNFITGCRFQAASLDTGGNSGSDFALVKLNRIPPSSFTPYYAGWNIAASASGSGVGIHHPSADIKKISTYTSTLNSVSWGGIASDTHWQILWAATSNGHGVTEGGSSGSPLFDANKRIVGTLTGGSSDCTTPTQNDFYGKFAYHWASNGSTPNKRLQNWLDPYNIGVQTLDGTYTPCAASVALDAGVSAIQPAGPICDSAVALTCNITNYGSQQLTSDVLTFFIDGGAAQQVNWTGALNTFQSTTVTLPAQTLSVGSHTISITSFSPNGGNDANTANDTRGSTFNVVGSSGQFFFDLQTGDQGSKITWELTDQQNYVLYSGGPYANDASGVEAAQWWCLPQGCYTFTIYSSAGNGLSGTSLGGTYTISDVNNNVVAQNHIVNFGFLESAQVCQNVSGISIIDAALNDITIYPNPSTGIFSIRNAKDASSLIVTDALGRVITTTALSNQAIQKIDLSGEESGVYFFKFISARGSAMKKVVLSGGK
jgi:hypothetical protein